MNVAQKCLSAMTYKGNRFGYAWRMALASYGYTRACDGYVIDEMGGTIRFSRWYAFWGAVWTWWDCVRNPR